MQLGLTLALALLPLAAAQTAAQTTPAKTATPANTTATTATGPQPVVGKNNLVSVGNYSFTAAGGWMMLKNQEGNAFLAGPAVKDKLNPSFSLVVTDLKDVKPENRILGVARDVRAQELPTLVKDFKWLGEKTVKVGKSSLLGVLWSYSGKEETDAFRWTQLTTIKGDRMYTVTLAIPDGTRPDVAAAGRAMFDSFNLK